MKKRRRPYLLLEVLLAMAIVLICLVPLIEPHISIAKQEAAWLEKNKMQKALYRASFETIENLYAQNIPWDLVRDEKEWVLAPSQFPWLEKEGLNGKVSFKIIHKKLDKEGFGYFVVNIITKLERKNIKEELELHVLLERQGQSSNAA